MPMDGTGAGATVPVCADAGVLLGPDKEVLFAPDMAATRGLMRAACELRWAAPGVEQVDDGFSQPLLTPPANSSSPGGGPGGRRLAALVRPPACDPVGFPSHDAMRAAVRDLGAGGGYEAAMAVSFTTTTAATVDGYTIQAAAAADRAALELQERLAGALGDSTTPALWRWFPLAPVYPASTYAFVARFLPLAVVVSWVYTLILCAAGVAGEREQGLEAAMRALGLRLWVHWAGHWGACMLLLGASCLFCGATAGGVFRTGNVESPPPPPPPRVCMSIHPKGKSCSHSGSSACCQ